MRRAATSAGDVADVLRRGEPLRLVLLGRGAAGEAVEVAERARAAGVEVRAVGPGVLRRFTPGRVPSSILGLVGPDPEAPLGDVLARRGAVWLLAGVRYAGNLGFAFRTAEVSGADAVVADTDADPARRRAALRASMHAEWLFPVRFLGAHELLDAAEGTHRVVGVEDTGARAPWETDLTGPVVLVVGGERDGIPGDVLRRCDEVVRVPMAGFIPSYNLQAAMAVVAVERLRATGSGSSAIPRSVRGEGRPEAR